MQREELGDRIGDRRAGRGDQRPAGIPRRVDVAGLDIEIPGALRAVGIDGYFDPIIVSGDFGYRKPDPRLFKAALTALRVAPENVLFVGNDMFRDIYAAKQCGIKNVFFSSNQGSKQSEGVKPDYIIYQFSEMRQAVDFFERQ